MKPNATAADLRGMKVEEAKRIYREKYWDAMRCDDLPAGIDYCVFDYGVNSGIGRAGKVLRRLLGLPDDSSVVTDVVVQAAGKRDPKALIAAICDERLRFLKSLKTWPVFGNGWGRRVAEGRAAAFAMANTHPGEVERAHRAIAARARQGRGRTSMTSRVKPQRVARLQPAAPRVAAQDNETSTVIVILAVTITVAIFSWLFWRWWQTRQQAGANQVITSQVIRRKASWIGAISQKTVVGLLVRRLSGKHWAASFGATAGKILADALGAGARRHRRRCKPRSRLPIRQLPPPLPRKRNPIGPRALAQIGKSQVEQVGQTRRAEIASGDPLQRWWRPLLRARTLDDRVSGLCVDVAVHTLWNGFAPGINCFASLSGLLMAYFAARFGVLGVYVSGRTREKLAGAGEIPALARRAGGQGAHEKEVTRNYLNNRSDVVCSHSSFIPGRKVTLPPYPLHCTLY